jgi:hypothetical protein
MIDKIELRELFKENLKKHLTGKIIGFKPNETKLLVSPCVYLFLWGGKVIYIGMSKRGILRALGKHKHQKDLNKHELIVCQAKSASDAKAIELIMIQKLKPKTNIAGNGPRMRMRIKDDITSSIVTRRLRKGWLSPVIQARS